MTNRNVLIIDDHIAWCKSIKKELEKLPILERVDMVYDGDAAMKYIHRELPGVIILDLLLPIYDGLYILEDIRRNMSGYIPFIYILSAFKTEKIDKTVEKLRYNYYSIKPIRPDVVAFNLNILLDQAPQPAEEEGGAFPREDLDEYVLDYLIKLGIPGNLLSTKCTRVALELFVQDADKHKNLTVLYQAVAQQFGMKPSAVERNIRNTVKKTIERATPFGQKCFADELGELTNNSFIFKSSRIITKSMGRAGFD